MEFFEKLFSAGGGLSSMRWVFIWTYLFCIVVPVGSWAIVYMHDHTVDIPANVLVLVLGVIGVITTGKVLQYGKEPKNNVVAAPQS